MSKSPCRVTPQTPPAELPYEMRADEVAVWLGMTAAAVRAAIKRGDIPARRRGDILRIRRDDLTAEPQGRRWTSTR
jgi:excisionase family DNA binding protein